MPKGQEHVLSINLKVDGSTEIKGDTEKVQTKDGDWIMRSVVDQRLDSPDYFSVELQMMRQGDFGLLDAIKPGSEIELGLGYETVETVFKGQVSYLEPSFSAESNTLTISGYDATHLLTRGTNSRTWGDGVKPSDEISAIASDVIKKSAERKSNSGDKLSVDTKATKTKLEYLAQVDVSDYDFIKSLGVASGLAIDAKSSEKAEKLAFKEPDIKASPKVTVCREKPEPNDARLAIAANFTLSTVRQVGKVEVRGWVPDTKKPILGKCEEVSNAFDGTSGPKTAGKAHYGSGGAGQVLTIIDCPVADEKEATALATAIFDALAMEFVHAEVKIRGVPEIGAGDVFEVKDFGTRYSGKYLATRVQHVAIAGAKEPYVTILEGQRNAAEEP